ncbi:Crp/Fnr family transcriptional regulator [Sphaerisporangium corydalis]|uniref:Crp/Fnr family transcriptional regulator n=1 Tax=Sphaerisporangium corydalis TaxID=1441875 RepID=A0ABV9ERY3_9ACTN|nr:Crp/Fnr family transcriptional regulator [Sphaerisporangium corydalis]
MPPEPWPKNCYLGALPHPSRDALLRLGRVRAYDHGEFLILQGDPGGVVYLLLTGRVNVIATVENGSESLLAIRYAGDVVGEMAMVGVMPRTASVAARVMTDALVVSDDVFLRFIEGHPEAARALTATSAERLRQANVFRADLAGYEVDRRLARALLYQLQRCPTRSNGCWTTDLLQAELAMLIGAKEGTVQKAISAMKGLIASRRGRVVITDVVGLARFAEIDPPEAVLLDAPEC